MAGIATKTLIITMLFCFVFDLAASEDVQQVIGDIFDTPSTTAVPSTFKDKFKGFVSSVKEGASDAFESVSDSVSGAAHKLDEKRKEAVAGTKKLVSGAIEKIKSSYDSYKNSDSHEEVTKDPESSEEVSKEINNAKKI